MLTLPKVWLTSDTHFGHENIIKYCNRPFNDVWQMNVALTTIWTGKVTDDDIVVHLGDLTLMKDPKKYKSTWQLIRSLPGKKILVRGNHDHPRIVPYLREIGWVIVNEIISENVTMRHIPPTGTSDADIVCAPDVFLHGHIHGKSHHRDHPSGNCYDVGVDATADYGPVLLDGFLEAKDLPRVKQALLDMYNANVINPSEHENV
jgi:calcineurin-like phosphoesterase family protein